MAPPPFSSVARSPDPSHDAISGQVQFGREFLSFLLSARQQNRPKSAMSPYPLEVVWVYSRFWLIDPESYQRTYCRKNGRSLAKGFYVISWPRGRGEQVYGEEAVFHGPYLSRKDAETSAELFQALLQSAEPGIRPRPTMRRVAAVKQQGVTAQSWLERHSPQQARGQPNSQY